MSAAWFNRAEGVITLSLHAQPGAKRTEIQGLHGDALKVRLAAPPIEGRANQELRRFLAELFQVPQRNVNLVSGEASRQKRFRIRGSAIDPMSLLDSQ
ncbi:MAG TPA: DUF167 domain-containing protein [Usitatibacteraceae bacterium]